MIKVIREEPFLRRLRSFLRDQISFQRNEIVLKKFTLNLPDLNKPVRQFNFFYENYWPCLTSSGN